MSETRSTSESLAILAQNLAEMSQKMNQLVQAQSDYRATFTGLFEQLRGEMQELKLANAQTVPISNSITVRPDSVTENVAPVGEYCYNSAQENSSSDQHQYVSPSTKPDLIFEDTTKIVAGVNYEDLDGIDFDLDIHSDLVLAKPSDVLEEEVSFSHMKNDFSSDSVLNETEVVVWKEIQGFAKSIRVPSCNISKCSTGVCKNVSMDCSSYFTLRTGSINYMPAPILKGRSVKPPAKPPEIIHSLHVDDFRALVVNMNDYYEEESSLLSFSDIWKCKSGVHKFLQVMVVDGNYVFDKGKVHTYNKKNDIDVPMFDGMAGFQDLVTWNSLLAAHVVHKQGVFALKVFIDMQASGFEPDVYTFTSVISSCLDDELGKSFHGLIFKKGMERSVSISNSLMYMYLKSDSKSLEDALRIYESMEKRDQVSGNSILTGFSQNGLSENALECFKQMLLEFLEIDQYAFSAVFKACSDLATLQLGQQVHNLAMKMGTDVFDYVVSSLIFMYCKCGCIEDARKAFDETPQDSASIIFGFAQHGQGNTALDLFESFARLYLLNSSVGQTAGKIGDHLLSTDAEWDLVDHSSTLRHCNDGLILLVWVEKPPPWPPEIERGYRGCSGQTSMISNHAYLLESGLHASKDFGMIALDASGIFLNSFGFNLRLGRNVKVIYIEAVQGSMYDFKRRIRSPEFFCQRSVIDVIIVKRALIKLKLEVVEAFQAIEVVIDNSLSDGRLDWVKNLMILLFETAFLNLGLSLDDCASVHVANRLGANSLLDIVVFGRSCANRVAEIQRPWEMQKPLKRDAGEATIGWLDKIRNANGPLPTSKIRLNRQRIMQNNAAVFRTHETLEEGCPLIDKAWESFHDVKIKDRVLIWNLDLIKTIELENLLINACITMHSAEARKESRGVHAHEDFTTRDDGVAVSAISVRISKFLKFSSPRPPEFPNLEDKVDFKERGMLRNGIIRD